MSELGKLLQKKRIELKKTLHAVAAETKIREPFLVIIENGEFDKLPSYIHAYGFVKKYAEYLNIPYEDIKPIFDAECVKEDKKVPNQELKPIEVDAGDKTFALVLKICLFIIAFVLCYIAYKAMFETAEENIVTISPKSVVEKADVTSQKPSDGSDTKAGYDNSSDNATYSYVNLAELSEAPSKDNQTAAVSKAEPTVATQVKQAVPAASENKPAEQVSPPVVKFVTLSFDDACWVSFTADDGISEEFSAIEGTIKRFSFINSFTIDVGNASALSIKYLSQSLTGFGAPGTVIKGMRYELKDGALIRVRR